MVDSGAIDNVMASECGSAFPTHETALSKKADGGYRSASGTFIKNQGVRYVQGVTEEGEKFNMGVQIAKVTKPLFSVRKMKAAGKRDI